MLHAQSAVEKNRLARVRELTRAPGSARRTLVEGWLEAADLSFERASFTAGSKKGTNLVVAMGPEGGPALLLSAHHDARKGSKGGNNNASGVVVLLGILERLAETPVPCRVIALFPDGSESGLAGSRAFSEANAGTRVLGAIVFEMCGRGDTVLIGPRRARVVNGMPDDAAEALQSLENAPPHRVLEDVAPTDHRVFASSGLEVCALSLAPAGQVDAIEAKFARRRGALPALYKDAFTGFDRATGVEASSLALAVRIGEGVVRSIAQRKDRGRPVVPGLLARQKALATVLAEEKLDGQLAEIAALGVLGAVPALVRFAHGEDQDIALRAKRLLGRVLSGSELRKQVPPEGTLNDVLSGLRAVHRRLTWDEEKRAFALQP